MRVFKEIKVKHTYTEAEFCKALKIPFTKRYAPEFTIDGTDENATLPPGASKQPDRRISVAHPMNSSQPHKRYVVVRFTEYKHGGKELK